VPKIVDGTEMVNRIKDFNVLLASPLGYNRQTLCKNVHTVEIVCSILMF
jgi:hypothetical protein